MISLFALDLKYDIKYDEQLHINYLHRDTLIWLETIILFLRSSQN